MKRIAAFFLCMLLLLSSVPGCTPKKEYQEIQGELRAAVLYYGADEAWEDIYSHLDQSLLVNLSAEAVDLSQPYTLEDYDLLYPDPSVMESPDAAALQEALIAYTEQGGALFLDNAFYDFFPKEFLGAKEFVKLDHCPVQLEIPNIGADYTELQNIILDFSTIFPGYTDYDRLSTYDYGWAVRPSTAKALATENGLALYTMNQYGDGYVFFTNPLLPNLYSVNGFSLTSRGEEQVSLASSTASANQLIRNAFAGFLSKQRYGFAAYRVFGSFGRPSMSWELHVEDINGIAQSTTTPFGELCREAGLIPSYALIRNTYYWVARLESVSYALNQAEPGAFSYLMDFEENAYSSGTHVADDQGWLHFSIQEDSGSYFVDYPEYTQRAYPYLSDLNGDEKLDLICGAADGLLYYCEGLGFSDHFQVSGKEPLTDASGSPLSVSGYSAPVLWDVDGDGLTDLISGASDGRIYWFSGNGSLTFEPQGVLLNTGLKDQVFPDVGDWNGDGAPDLIVGSNLGTLRLYLGDSSTDLNVSSDRWQDLSQACSDLGTWLAPRMVDLNGDGALDLALGTFDGYVARMLKSQDGSLTFDGYFTAQENNYKGNNNLKFGNNCVPFFADLDGDSSLDLLVGCFEYGLAYPIDSPYFPYREELQRGIDAILENDYYLGLHFYTNVSASPQREAYELAAHKRALESYGVDTSRIGANQHTWHLSALSQTQSFLQLWDAGLLWNSGFEPACSSATPQLSVENAMALPFFLTVDGERTILLQNNSTLTYLQDPYPQISAKYDMPTCVYYHCDWLFKSYIEEQAHNTIQQVADFQAQYNYNFVKEDQMMLATAAAYNLTLDCTGSIQDLTLTPGAAQTNFPLYQEDFQNACGVRLSFAQSVNRSNLCLDADVWYWDGDDLYVALNRPIRIFQQKGSESTHLERVNLPAQLTLDDGVTRVAFQEGGMMQVAVSGSVEVLSQGWTQTQEGTRTVLTKFGQPETLELRF